MQLTTSDGGARGQLRQPQSGRVGEDALDPAAWQADDAEARGDDRTSKIWSFVDAVEEYLRPERRPGGRMH